VMPVQGKRGFPCKCVISNLETVRTVWLVEVFFEVRQGWHVSELILWILPAPVHVRLPSHATLGTLSQMWASMESRVTRSAWISNMSKGVSVCFTLRFRKQVLGLSQVVR